MKLWLKFILISLAFVGLVACGGGEDKKDDDAKEGGDAGAAVSENLDDAELTTVKLGIEGMACGVNCPPKVKAQLAAVDGVKSCEIDFDSKTATVKVAKDAGVNVDKLVAAVSGQFTASAKN